MLESEIWEKGWNMGEKLIFFPHVRGKAGDTVGARWECLAWLDESCGAGWLGLGEVVNIILE